MFQLTLKVPVYYLNEYKTFGVSGEIIATWTGENLLEGDISIKQQVAAWLKQQEAGNRIVDSYNDLLVEEKDAQRRLDLIKREIETGSKKLETLRKFLTNLGFDPNSTQLSIVDDTVRELKAATPEIFIPDEYERDEYEEEMCDPADYREI
jgi:hypothetical protein